MNSRKAIVTFFFTFCCAGAALADVSALGSWDFPAMTSNGIVFSSVITFESEKVSLKNTCTVGAQSVTVNVSVSAKVTETEISTLAKAQKSVSENGVNCEASIDQSTMTYVVSAEGTSITLSQGGQSMALSRHK